MKKLVNNGKTNGSKSISAHHPPKLPRSLSSPALKKKHKLAVVFQGGSVADRMQTAHLLADHLALKLYRVDIRPIVSSFIGETEKNIDQVFNRVEPEETLLYFDEADMLFGKDCDAKTDRGRMGRGWVSYFNKRLQDFPGKVLLATSSHSRTSKLSGRLKPVVAHIS